MISNSSLFCTFISTSIQFYLNLLPSKLSYLILSYLILSYSIPSYSTLFHPIVISSILFYPILLNSTLSYSFNSIISYSILFHSIQSFSILSYPTLFYALQFDPTQFNAIPSHFIPTHPIRFEVKLPGMETNPTTDIIFKLGIRAARIADLMAGNIASFLVAPKASLVSDSCLLSATSASNRSTATAGPEIELPIIIPAVGTLL